jgi:predicted  nucleic acid-binding Zn-ribbon protein
MTRPFDLLLDVQEHDTNVDQLVHRKASLPERAELADVERRIAALQAERSQVAGPWEEVVARESKAEEDIAAAEKRIAEIDTRMTSGAVTASRDLQAMSEEITHLRERISSLEDAGIEALTEREPLDAELARIDGALAALAADGERLRAVIAETEAAIDAEIAAVRAERGQLAGGLPADLAATYERLRDRLGGIGAARLEGARCTGCHLTLPATEVDRLKREPPDALVFCDQCGRILVRP